MENWEAAVDPKNEGDWRVLWPIKADAVVTNPKQAPARDTQVGGDHYKKANAMQPWDIIDAWGLDFYAGNVLKYILRARYKNGLEDYRKARHYLDKIIENYENSSGTR